MNLQWNYRGKGLTQKMQQIQTHHATFFPSLSHPLPPISFDTNSSIDISKKRKHQSLRRFPYISLPSVLSGSVF